MTSLDKLPRAKDALFIVCDKCRSDTSTTESGAIPRWSARAIRAMSILPELRGRARNIPTELADRFSQHGLVRFSEAGSRMIVFRDLVMVSQGEGDKTWISSYKPTTVEDLTAPLAEVARSGNETWLTSEEVLLRSTSGMHDPRMKVDRLTQQLKDILAAQPTGTSGHIFVRCSISPGDEGVVAADLDVPSSNLEFIQAAATHAVESAGLQCIWEPGFECRFVHFDSSWKAIPVTVIVKSSPPPSSVLRATLQRAAANRTLDWLKTSGAPDSIIQQASAYTSMTSS